MATRVLLTGASGYLGRRAVALAPAEVDVCAPPRRGPGGLDLTDVSACARVLEEPPPDLVLHLAALSTIGACESDPGLALQVNGHATRVLAQRAPRIVFASTDLVFGGDRAPYGPGDPTAPLSVYGRTKVRGEEAVLAAGRGLVVRLPLLFGRSFDGTRGATDMVRSALADGRELHLFTDEYRTPLHVDDAARALWQLALGPRTGIVHVAGRERVSRWELGQRFAALAGLDAARLVASLCTSPLRPKDVSLRSDVAIGRSLEQALVEC